MDEVTVRMPPPSAQNEKGRPGREAAVSETDLLAGGINTHQFTAQRDPRAKPSDTYPTHILNDEAFAYRERLNRKGAESNSRFDAFTLSSDWTHSGRCWAYRRVDLITGARELVGMHHPVADLAGWLVDCARVEVAA